MKLTANRSVASCITKGNSYDIVTETDTDFLIIDDEGFQVGFNKSYFDPENIFITHTYPLFEHLSKEHGLNLLQSELLEIIDVCRVIIDKNQ